jgi:hypothetical protein
MASFGIPGKFLLVASMFLWIFDKKWKLELVRGRSQLASSSVGVMRWRDE